MRNNTFKPYLAYSASAGSGKTFALSVRYISLLFLDQNPNTILAATFTNKAAIEMKQRVLSLLINLANKKAELDSISEQTGFGIDELLAKQPEILDRFLSSSNFIVTLDSFFTSMLRSSSQYIDIKSDFVIKEIDGKLKEQNFLAEIDSNSLLPDLVRLAIDIEDKRFLKMFELMQNFYKIDPLMPNKEYKLANITNIEGKIEEKREILHKLIIESGASKTAIKNFEPNEAKVLFKKTVFEKESLLNHRNYKKYVIKNPTIEDEFLSIKEMLKEWVEIKEQVVLHNIFQIFDYYKNATTTTAKELGVLSFDDLSYFTYQLLQKTSKEFIYFKMDSGFRHILLDEFQDTSTLQFLLLKPLIDNVFVKSNSEFRSFFYVGDTKQSLYRFRGGVEELFDAVAHQYKIKIAQMDTNYRSSINVIEQVNRWFAPNMLDFPIAKYRDGASEGFVEVRESEELIYEAIASLEFLLESGILIKDITFLVSTNRDGATIQEACFEKGYATRLKTSSSLKHIPKVASIVAMVEYLFSGLSLDAKALLQRVGKKIEEIDTSWFYPFMEPVVVVDKLIEEFGYFENDSNLLKLLEFASDFSNIASFIDEFKFSTIEVASNTKDGAMIMTIHGSKGLEFEHVIVLDRLKGNAPDRSMLLYDYDKSLHIKEVFYKMSKRENFDESYKIMLEKHKKLSEKDKMNLLYVALTRAVESMIVIRKPKKSIFDTLDMTTMSVGLLTKPVDVEPSVYLSDKIVKTVITDYGTKKITKVKDKEIDTEAILFGTALHYTLEMIPSFTVRGLAEAINITKNYYSIKLNEKQFIDIENRILLLVKDKRFNKLLKDSKISKEQSLSFEGEFKQIDLLLEYKKSCVVLDYKSSKKYNVKHQSQVRYYKKAIFNITGKYTKGMIVYLLEDRVELVEV